MPSLLEKALLKRFAPACVVINEQGDIHFIQGRTGDYLDAVLTKFLHHRMALKSSAKARTHA